MVKENKPPPDALNWSPDSECNSFFNASIRANLDELRNKLYNGAAPPDLRRNSWYVGALLLLA